MSEQALSHTKQSTCTSDSVSHVLEVSWLPPHKTRVIQRILMTDMVDHITPCNNFMHTYHMYNHVYLSQGEKSMSWTPECSNRPAFTNVGPPHRATPGLCSVAK